MTKRHSFEAWRNRILSFYFKLVKFNLTLAKKEFLISSQILLDMGENSFFKNIFELDLENLNVS